MPTEGRAGADPVHRALVKRIDAIAKRQGISANKLADLSGIARGYLSEMRSGQKSPTVRTLIKIARALNVSLRDLFD